MAKAALDIRNQTALKNNNKKGDIAKDWPIHSCPPENTKEKKIKIFFSKLTQGSFSLICILATDDVLFLSYPVLFNNLICAGL